MEKLIARHEGIIRPEVRGHALVSSASLIRMLGFVLLLIAIGALSFVAGLRATVASAAEEPRALPSAMQQNSKGQTVIYPGKTKLDFEGAQIEGERRNPGEFYFLSRDSEKFDSLVRRRKNFHREMLRDVVLTK